MGIGSELRDALLTQPKSFKKKKEYAIEEVLGRGGYGKVVRATWSPPEGEKKDVALKIIPKKLVNDPAIIMAEINVLKDLDSEHIVHVWDYFESRDKYYITFELATGGELFDRITQKGRFTENDAADAIGQVLKATAYLHSHNIVHRDLKPENILYKTKQIDSPLVIADFGIARHLMPDEEITTMAGSFGYAAPEILLGKPHGFKVDMWSIGIICYTLLCGYSPFRSDDKQELIAETTKGRVVFHDRFWKHVSMEAREFIKALLAVDPKARMSAADALRHPWLRDSTGDGFDLSSNIKENFNPQKKWKDAVRVIRLTNRFRSAASGSETPLGLSSDSEESEGFQSCESLTESSSSRRKSHSGNNNLAAVVAAKRAEEAKQSEVAGDLSRLSVK